MRLSQAVPAFLEYKRYVRNVRPSSADTYQKHLGRFMLAVGRSKTLEEAAARIEPYLIAMGQRGRKATYRAKVFLVLRDLYRWACDHGHASRNPLREAKAPMIHDTEASFLTEPEVQRLLKAIWTAPFRHARRDHALTAALYYSWIRVGEAVRSRPEDFDLGDCTVRVFGKGGKQRLIPFDPDLAGILKGWLKHRPNEFPWMFPSQMADSAAAGMLTRDRVARTLRVLYAPKAGLAGRVTPHVLRRSGADHARKRGARLEAIQHVLRHKSITTTMKYLRIPGPDELREVWRKA